MTLTTDAERTVPPPGGPRRILHVINLGTLAGGAERQLAALVAVQRAAGHEVRVLSSDLTGAGARFSDLTWKQPRRTGLLARLAGQLTNAPARDTLARVVADWQPGVVHLHTVGLLSPAALDVLAGTPTVLTVHGPEIYVRDTERWCLPDHYFRATPGGRRFTWRGRAAMFLTALVGRCWRQRLRVVDVFLTPSRFLADRVARDFAPTRVAPNGRVASTAAPSRRAGSSSRLLFVGRLEHIKGVEVAVDALAVIAHRHPGATLTIAGSGPAEEKIRRRVAARGLGDRVEFAGWLDTGEVEQQLATADVLVVPSLCPEAFGLVCLEAFAAGTPVVASAVGGLPEIVRHEETGLLVPPGDVPGLAAAVDRVLGDDDLRRRLAEAGAGLVGEFTLEAHARAVGEGYREAVDRHRGRTGRRSSFSPVRSLTERGRQVLADSLLRNSALLLLATIQLAGGGFLFWQLAAHLYSPADVGRASAAISATTLIANLALLGMNNAAIRYLPQASDPRPLVNTGLSVVAGAALIGSALYAVLHTGMPGLTEAGHVGEGFAMIVLTTIGAVGLFYDNIFVALRRSGYVLARNSVVVTARLIAPLLLVGIGGLGVFVAYWAAAAVALPVYLVTLCRMGLAPRLAASRTRLREMWRYAAGNYVATAILITPGLLMPVLVAARLGPVSAAHYYIASLVASVLLFVPQALGRSLFAELIHDPAGARRHMTRVLRLAAVTQTPLLAVMVLFGRPLLGLFGGPYTEGYPLLILIASAAALSSVPYVGSTLLLATGRIRLLCLLSAGAYSACVAAALLVADRGINAIGAALLAGEVLLSLGYLPILARALRSPAPAPTPTSASASNKELIE